MSLNDIRWELEAIERLEAQGFQFRDRYLEFVGCFGSRIIVDVVVPKSASTEQAESAIRCAEEWGRRRTRRMMKYGYGL